MLVFYLVFGIGYLDSIFWYSLDIDKILSTEEVWIKLLCGAKLILATFASTISYKNVPFIFIVILASLSGHLCNTYWIKDYSCEGLLRIVAISMGNTPATFLPLCEIT
jgi:hypothetical protein